MRRRVTIEVDGTIFAIKGWQAHRFALEAGLRPTYNGVHGAWVADTKKLPQFCAYLEHRNVGYDVARESSDSRVQNRTPVADETPVQLDLFGSR